MEETKISTRTFPELWKSFSKSERYFVVSKITEMSLCSESAVRSWGIGHRRPEPIHQLNIVKALKSIGITTEQKYLFP